MLRWFSKSKNIGVTSKSEKEVDSWLDAVANAAYTLTVWYFTCTFSHIQTCTLIADG